MGTKLAILVALFLAAAARQATAVVSSGTLEAIDAQGHVLGTAIDDQFSRATVPLLINNFQVRVTVQRAFLAGPGPNRVYFASNNCTGQAYVEWVPEALGQPHAIVTLSNTVYAGPRGSTQPVTTNSVLKEGSDACVVSFSGGPVDLFPVAKVLSLSPEFQPPFDLRVVDSLSPVPAPALGLGGLAVLASLLAVLAFRRLRPAA